MPRCLPSLFSPGVFQVVFGLVRMIAELLYIFVMMDKAMIYLDNAASTPLDGMVLDVMTACQRDIYGNPSSVHGEGRKARVAVEQARRTIAGLMNVSPSEVFFTSGGTEANNAILWGCARDFGHRHFITSRLEHPAVLRPLEVLREAMDIHVHHVEVDPLGHIDTDHLAGLLRRYPGSVVSLMHANNETGNLLPVKAVAALCREHQAPFHSDTVQTAGKFNLDIDNLDIDYAVASAHKFHGPKGAGFMVVRPGKFFKPFITGGTQERNMRAGTENVCGIVGMAKALEVAHERMEEDQVHIAVLKKECIRLLREQIPGVTFNGDAEGSSLHTILNLSLPAGTDAEMLLPKLDIAGICVSSGSACASGTSKGSHVLEALGADPDRPSLRVSFSRYNALDEVATLVKNLNR